MKRSFFALVLACALLLPSSASAMMVRSGEQFTLPRGETVRDDLYAAGGFLNIDGAVEGDAFLAGGNVFVTGRVSQDLTVGGGTVDIDAEIGDDLRIGGGTITVRKNVKGDVLIGGGNVYIRKDAVIDGDLAIGGGQVVIDGTVRGKVLVGGGIVVVNGALLGEVDVIADDSLTFGPQAKITQAVRFQGRKQAEVMSGADLKGGVQFTELPRGKQVRKDFDKDKLAAGIGIIFGIGWLIETIALLIGALIAVGVFTRFSKDLVEHVMKQPWMALLHGFGFAILVPAAVLALLFTFVGSYLAGVIGVVYGLMLLLAKIYAGIIAGAWVLHLPHKTMHVEWKGATLGVVGLALIGLIPVLGWIVVCFAFLLALGGLYGLLLKQLKSAR